MGEDDSYTTKFGRLRWDPLAGAWELLCPGCIRWGHLDDDQFHGRISVDHTGQRYRRGEGWATCTYHETHDFSAEIPDLRKRPEEMW